MPLDDSIDESFPFTPGMQRVFEGGLVKHAQGGEDASLVVLKGLLDCEDLNGTRMIVDLSGQAADKLMRRFALRGFFLRVGSHIKRAQSTEVILTEAHSYLWKAKEHAILLGHTWVGTEHLVLAMLNDPATKAFQYLKSYGVTRAKALEWLEDFLRISELKKKQGN